MRVSVNRKDPGFIPFKRLGGYGCVDVYLDGQRLRGCVTADTKTGWVTVYDRDASGSLILNSKGTAARMKRLRGVVEIRAIRHAS